MKRTFETTIVSDGAMSFIPLPFDPKEAFGKVRAPVVVTVGKHTYRSTIFSMKGVVGVPLRTSNREAAGVAHGQRVKVTLELDTAPREVAPPDDLVQALQSAPPAWERWQQLSFTHQREWVEAVEGAKKPETRAKRIANAVAAMAQRPAKKG
jgi:hypothetical protein